MKISVIIPVYNAEKYLTAAVESALQFPEVFEVIMVEDKSPDNALDVCKKLVEQHGSRVKLLQHPDKENHGAGASRNLGIQNASGDFIAFLDADDFYLPNRFDAEKKLFTNPEVEGVYGAIGVHYHSEKAKAQYYGIYSEKLTTVYRQHPPEDVFTGLLNLKGPFGLFHLDGLTLRRSAISKAGDLFKTHLRLHQDTEYILRLAYYLKLYPGIIDKAVAMRGVHESNRITKVDSGKVKAAISRLLLWEEINRWAENTPEMASHHRKHIRRLRQSFEIAAAPTAKKWMMIFQGLVTDYQSIRSGLYNINFRKELF